MTVTLPMKGRIDQGVDQGVSLDIAAVRAAFPILARRVHGRKLVFLDSAASAQKPRAVIDAVARVYEYEYANVHRGVYALSEACTARYEGARETVRRFLNAADTREIIFTRNATEAINLVAQSFGRSALKPGDEIVISALEHHANIVPWQMLRDATGAVLKVAPIEDNGALEAAAMARLIGPRTRLVAVSHMSNVLGTVTPVAAIVEAAHAAGAKVLLDGCQAVTHFPVDVRALGCDFYVFSGHKLYGPTGIGVLYGREALLDAMPPWQGGGDMILTVTFEGSTWAGLPHKFEAGTPAIAQAIGLAAAIDFVEGLGFAAIEAHETDLLEYACARLGQVPGLRLIGTAPGKRGVLSFVLGDIHAHDVATILDHAGVAVRAGHHCAQPLMARMGVAATVRASIGLYNTRGDIDALAGALHDAREIFAT